MKECDEFFYEWIFFFRERRDDNEKFELLAPLRLSKNLLEIFEE